MQTSRASLPRHACFGRWEHKLIGASTHLAYLQGVNYDVHGWVGFVYFILIKSKLNRLLIWLVFLCSVRKNGVFFLNYRKLFKTSLAVLHRFNKDGTAYRLQSEPLLPLLYDRKLPPASLSWCFCSARADHLP